MLAPTSSKVSCKKHCRVCQPVRTHRKDNDALLLILRNALYNSLLPIKMIQFTILNESALCITQMT
jgi:hypothetical protein